MNDLRNELRLVEPDELAWLLTLNREDEISAAQLARLDCLLEPRGKQIETHIAALHFPDKQVA